MNWPEALDVVVARTKHEPYRRLCSDENTSPPPNDRDAYRDLMVRLAENPPKPSEYPPLSRQLANVAGAAARAVMAAVTGQPVLVSAEERGRRQAICRAPCAEYDAAQDRCKACGCGVAVKPYLRSEACPKGYW
jgi:hypothetical protein